MNRHDNRLCSSDDLARLLQTFAQRYIRKTFISRFMHEAKKNPNSCTPGFAIALSSCSMAASEAPRNACLPQVNS